MATSRDRLSRRQKACLSISVFLIVFGVLLVLLGTLFTVQYRNRKCHRMRSIMVGVYLVLAGIFGAVGYCPRRAKHMSKAPKRVRGGRACISTFVIFCALVTVVVALDNSSALHCVPHNDLHSNQATARLYAILSFVEITGAHLAQILCALSVGLASPDLFFPHTSTAAKYQRNSTGSKNKSSKLALHLPEARTHIQEAAGTGETVTVVSLPETEGIVYAVPEEQYVIRRGEATYMAPLGNTNLASFFPTYTKVELE